MKKNVYEIVMNEIMPTQQPYIFDIPKSNEYSTIKMTLRKINLQQIFQSLHVSNTIYGKHRLQTLTHALMRQVF